ncbi:MAG: ABC transporter ATP-binding protein [Planctomycetota bacterium]
MNPSDKPILSLEDLRVDFVTDDELIHAVCGVSFEVHRGETLAIVGESGSGKSVTNLAMMGLLPRPPAVIRSGAAQFGGEDLLQLPEDRLRQIRGRHIAMIFQDPMTSLNPLMTVGQQLTEVTRLHLGLTRREADRKAIEMLGLVEIPHPERRLRSYPHEFSGGMRQRVMIAMALSCEPELLIADEPTTALDVTIQAQIIDLLADLQQRRGTAIVLITHDLGVVAGVADRVAVMLEGQVVETGDAVPLFANPQHAYTEKLLSLLPRVDVVPSRIESIDDEHGPNLCDADQSGVSESDAPLLAVEDLKVHFPLQTTSWFRSSNEVVKAVDGVSFEIHRGETLGLVGESGCGKSTTARTIINLGRPTEGKIEMDGNSIAGLPESKMKPFRRRLQMIFQDPFASLNPRMTVGSIIGEPLAIHGLASGRDRALEVLRLLELVELGPRFLNRYPHEFSGGQRQRIGIARALAVQPELILCDEPVSALDVSIQAQIMTLLMDLQQRLGVAYLFISHDLAVVRHLADRVGVMYQGRLVEMSSSQELYDDPQHPYTRSLLSAVPIPDPTVKRQRIVWNGA